MCSAALSEKKRHRMRKNGPYPGRARQRSRVPTKAGPIFWREGWPQPMTDIRTDQCPHLSAAGHTVAHERHGWERYVLQCRQVPLTYLPDVLRRSQRNLGQGGLFRVATNAVHL